VRLAWLRRIGATLCLVSSLQDSPAGVGARWRPSRVQLGAALGGVVVLAVAAVLLLSGGGSGHSGTKALAGSHGTLGTSASHARTSPRLAPPLSTTPGSSSAPATTTPGAGRPATTAPTTAKPAHSPSTSPAHSPAAQSPTEAATAGVQVVGQRRLAANEVPDPEAARSYPAPASARHKAAITPHTAAEAAVAPGAPSDAEIRRELGQMRAAERAAQHQTFTPVAGGQSIGGNGTITPPPGIPAVIARVIAGANAIADFPYVYGGGHASFVDNAYDCSGSVSYALAAGGLLSAPETSGELESWGVPGPGRWITVFANAGHTYMYIDGMLYDTAGRSGVYASRWLVGATDNSGYVERHYPGL
jgi:cell wall-associated NlpC family hydrolase